MLKKNQPLELYGGWYSRGGYPLYPDGIKFKRRGPPLPRQLTHFYEGDGLPALPPEPQIVQETTTTIEKMVVGSYDLDEVNVPKYGSDLLPKRDDSIYTGYDKEGLPIFPDGTSRPYSLVEIQQMAMKAPRMSHPIPKRPTKSSRYKLRKRKNPPPSKVDLDQMFRDEKDRLDRMQEYK